MRRILALAVSVFCGCLSPLAAQTPPRPAETPRADAGQARFSFTPVTGGMLRLDSRTGQVSHCTLGNGDYACRTVPDDRVALEDEIRRLTDENARLRADLAAKGGAPSAGEAKKSESLVDRLPSEQEIDKAMGVLEGIMRRMMRIMRDETAPNQPL
jgi:hypothetical protein